MPPIAGAFWTPKQPPAYDKSLPAHPVTYSEEEKAAQRAAYQKQHQGLKDAIGAGETSYTFPPGVYRSSETMHIEAGHMHPATSCDAESLLRSACLPLLKLRQFRAGKCSGRLAVLSLSCSTLGQGQEITLTSQ